MGRLQIDAIEKREASWDPRSAEDLEVILSG
jgi:hypothetical protein